MSPPCPDPADLAAFAERRLPAADQERVEAHLAACPDCLGEVRILAAPSPRLPAARWALAAAVLLLAISLGLWRTLNTPAPLPGPSREGAPPAFRLDAGTLLEGGGRVARWRLSGEDRLALAAGAKARVVSDEAGTLLEGRLWMDTSSGKARVIGLPGGGEVRLADAEVLVTLEPGPSQTLSGIFLGAAWAVPSPSATVLCRRGACRILWEGRESAVPAGTEAALVPGSAPALHPLSPEAVEQAAAWIWEAAPGDALEVLAGKAEGLSVTRTGKTLQLSSAAGFGRLPLGPAPEGDFRLELSVRPLRTAGDLGLTVPGRSRCPYWMMGATPLPGGRWTRLVVERRGGQARLWRDGELAGSLPDAALEDLTPASNLPALGLWGADVEVRDLCWKAFP